AEIMSAFSGVPARSRLYAAGSYFLKTAYVPVMDSLGIPAAVLGVEADARAFAALRAFRNSQLLISGLSLLAIVAIVAVSIALARHALRVERAASRANTLALMGQLSGALAHEIRNPLAIIRAAAERVRIRYDAGEDQTLGYILEEVDRLNSILANYLSLGSARPDSVEPVELDRLAAEVLTAVEPETRRLGIAVETALDNLPTVRANRLALRQALLNLVLNAIQAQPGGGLLRLSGESAVNGRHRQVVLRVSDHGPGITPEDLKRVFAPFYTTKEKGSGLGLFVVKRIVEEHGGRVSASSTPGQGTTIEMRLPA
ncbi:MAG: ATP-binding protein, partial [candidate division WOR-3 bacterium]